MKKTNIEKPPAVVGSFWGCLLSIPIWIVVIFLFYWITK